MEDNVVINQILESHDDSEEFEFKYNFINTPWDDRSNKSKVGIVALLIAIFIATMACIANNFVMHYRGFPNNNTNHSEISCFRVKIEEHRYVARIHSVSSKELLCVGAVVSPTSILACGICVKSGPIRVFIGSPTDPHCKKGFTVDTIEPVSHDGLVSQKLVLLSSFESMQQCTYVVPIGTSLDWQSKVHIIGRPLSIGRTLSRQLVTLAGKDFMALGGMKYFNIDNMVCVKDLAQCPVGVGDLLVQNGALFGLAATSVHSSGRNKIACFADLDVVRNQLKELDTAIKV